MAWARASRSCLPPCRSPRHWASWCGSFAAGAARDWLLTVALAIVTVGILGNLYDRLGLPGLVWNNAYPGHQPGDPVYAVRDFILVMIGRWPWPTFNLADSSLVCGAALLMWHALFTKTMNAERLKS